MREVFAFCPKCRIKIDGIQLQILVVEATDGTAQAISLAPAQIFHLDCGHALEVSASQESRDRAFKEARP